MEVRSIGWIVNQKIDSSSISILSVVVFGDLNFLSRVRMLCSVMLHHNFLYFSIESIAGFWEAVYFHHVGIDVAWSVRILSTSRTCEGWDVGNVPVVVMVLDLVETGNSLAWRSWLCYCRWFLYSQDSAFNTVSKPYFEKFHSTTWWWCCNKTHGPATYTKHVN